MKRILIVTNHYLPGYKAGGPIKSISALCKSLKINFDITVMTLNHDFGESKNYEGIKFDESIPFNEYKVLYTSRVSLKKVYLDIKSINPDIIYLNSYFSKITQIVLILKKLNIIKSKIILAPRGELSKGALSIKSKKKYVFLKIMKLLNMYNKDIIFHSTDKMEKYDIMKYFDNKLYNIPNLTIKEDAVFPIAKKNKQELNIIFLSRISRKKNLLFALEVLLEYKYYGKLNFDIYGTLEDMEYWNSCQEIIKKLENNVTVNYKGEINPKYVSECLSHYHMFFLPTKNENFGHAIVESMESGLIQLISDQTPWVELEKYKVGYSLSLKKKDVFANAINTVLEFGQEEFNEISINVKKYINIKINNDKSIKNYIDMFNYQKYYK